jgi:xanthine dehydrogenase accessory factor
MDIYEELIRQRIEGRSCALATIVNAVGSVPSHASAKMLVRDDGSIVGTIGGGPAEGRAITVALEVLQSGSAQMISINLQEDPKMDAGMVCGGHLDIFVEAVQPAPVAFLFGAGHIGLVTARLVHTIGLDVAIIDDRPEFANKERFPCAREIHAGELKNIIGGLRPDRRSLIFIATRSHEFDTDVLAWALGTPAGYIGMLGSRRKILTVAKKLMAEGVTREQLARVHAPVGLNIRADTPEEIAIAVVAQMIAHIRNAEAVRPLVVTMDDLIRPRAAAAARLQEVDLASPEAEREDRKIA